jgi:hypothetical protein
MAVKSVLLYYYFLYPNAEAVLYFLITKKSTSRGSKERNIDALKNRLIESAFGSNLRSKPIEDITTPQSTLVTSLVACPTTAQYDSRKWKHSHGQKSEK